MKTFGFAHFTNAEGAIRAMKLLNGLELGSEALQVLFHYTQLLLSSKISNVTAITKVDKMQLKRNFLLLVKTGFKYHRLCGRLREEREGFLREGSGGACAES